MTGLWGDTRLTATKGWCLRLCFSVAQGLSDTRLPGWWFKWDHSIDCTLSYSACTL